MSYQKKILVFTATYNEAENIYELISLIKTQPSNPHVLIIDDNSPDGTSDKVVKSQSKFKDIFLIKRNKKLLQLLDTKKITNKEVEELRLAINKDYVELFWIGHQG